MTPSIEIVLRHDRLVVGAGLVLVAALSWIYLLMGAGMGMSGLEMTRHNNMAMMAPGTWNMAYIALMFFMWWIMMIAMMLPSATPVILLAAALNRKSLAETAPYGSSAAFAAGYLLAWGIFSVVAVMTQWGLQEAELISGMLRSNSQSLSALILVIAGAWQFTPWKHTCLRHCRGPVDFLTRTRRPGNAGALRMGMHHGFFCLGCCWFLMALLFVGGVMNLYWIAGLAVYVWVEKILPSGETLSRLMGGLLIAWGAAILF